MFRVDIDTRQAVIRARGFEGSLPVYIAQALNFTAFDTRDALQADMQQAFDRPTQFTLRSPLVKQATQANLVSEVFIRNEASGGTPPSVYLLPEAQGGAREQKPFEFTAQAIRPTLGRKFYVPGKGAKLDPQGNIPSGVIKKIMSQLQISERFAGHTSNESTTTRRRRLSRQRKKGGGGSYFILDKKRGKLLPGVVYERIGTGFGSAVRSVLFGVDSAPRYRQRFDILKQGAEIFSRTFPEKLRRAIARNGR